MRRNLVTSSTLKVTTVGLALALAAGCSTKASDGSSGSGSSDAGGIKTDVGVTDDTITLGVLTDMTGVFAVLGKSITQAAQLYFDDVNSKGGICDRQVELLIQDHGYDVQKAVSLYADSSTKVLGYEQMLGSPITAALSQNIETDKVLTAPASWASSLLANPYVAIMGTTYDIEQMNGYQFLMDEKGLKKGDTVGHIYFEGEYGANGLKGAQYAADQLGLNLKPVQIKPTDQDMTSQVTSLKAAGVKAISVTAGPLQSASITGVDAALGLNVPVLSNNPGFVPALLDTPAGPAMEKLFYLSASSSPFGDAGTSQDVQTASAEYEKAYPKAIPDGGVIYGYGVAEAYSQVLQKACDNGDLTRDGVESAFRETSNVDTGGVIATLDFSDPGQPASRMTYVAQPKAGIPGGLTVVKDLFESDLATNYDINSN